MSPSIQDVTKTLDFQGFCRLLSVSIALLRKVFAVLCVSVGTKDPKVQLCDLKSGSRIHILQGE